MVVLESAAYAGLLLFFSKNNGVQVQYKILHDKHDGAFSTTYAKVASGA